MKETEKLRSGLGLASALALLWPGPWQSLVAVVQSLLHGAAHLLRDFRYFLRIRRAATLFPGPPALPIVGNIHEAFKYDNAGLLDYAIKIGSQYPLGRYYIGPLPLFYVSDPRDVERVLINPRCNDKPLVYNNARNWLGTGLILASGDLWKRHSKIISPTFHMNVLESFIPIYNRHADVFIQQLRNYINGEYFDLMMMAEHLSLKIICEAAMGVNTTEESSLEYMQDLLTVERCVVQRALRPWLLPEWALALSALGREQAEALKRVHALRDRVIQQRKRDLIAETHSSTNGKKRHLAFLDHLLISVREGAQLTDKEVADEVDTFMFAGHDTNSVLLSFSMYELARNPDVQDKVLEELESLYDPSSPNIDMSAEDLRRIVYLEMVLKETLRLHPPVPIVARVIKEDVKLATQNLVLPAGAQVGIGIMLTHMHPEFFPEPTKFSPERFSPENARSQHSCAFIPFAAGQRSCIGKRLALMEAKTVMAKVLWKYKILPEPGFKPVISWGVTIKPVNGMRVRLQLRQRGVAR